MMSGGIWHTCGCLLNHCSRARLIWPATHVSKLFVISLLLLTSRLHHSFIQSLLLVKRMLPGDHSNKLGLSSGPGYTMMMPMTLHAVMFVCLQKMKAPNAEPCIHFIRLFQLEGCDCFFKKHQLNACHCEAVDVMITIPATRKEFGE